MGLKDNNFLGSFSINPEGKKAARLKINEMRFIALREPGFVCDTMAVLKAKELSKVRTDRHISLLSAHGTEVAQHLLHIKVKMSKLFVGSGPGVRWRGWILVGMGR